MTSLECSELAISAHLWGILHKYSFKNIFLDHSFYKRECDSVRDVWGAYMVISKMHFQIKFWEKKEGDTYDVF